MPRPKKPARLWQRYDGSSDREAGNDKFAWIILDEGKQHSTGARGHGGRRTAEEALARYLAGKLTLPVTPQPPDAVSVDLILTYYIQNLRENMAAPERQAYALKALTPFWHARSCADISETTCRAYMKTRPSPSTARRELGVLRAALRAAHRARVLQAAPAVWLPPKGRAKPDWLTRNEFAKLLRELRRHRRSRHAARQALCQFYTGSRPRTVARTTWDKRSDGPWVDLEAGIWWRAGDDEEATVKARRPHGIPAPLLGHLRRWRARYGGTYIVEHPRHPGRPVLDIGRALEGAAARAGIKRLTPHTLKHTAITLAIQGGVSAEDAADYFSTSIETIQAVYGPHSPHHQSRAIAAMSAPGKTATKRNETPGYATK